MQASAAAAAALFSAAWTMEEVYSLLGDQLRGACQSLSYRLQVLRCLEIRQ